MGLAAYRNCTFAEKRSVLRTFWSQRAAESEKVERAAREYGPYAFRMVAIITGELAVVSAALFAAGNAWAWAGVLATVFAGLSTWKAQTCVKAIGRVTLEALSARTDPSIT